MKTAYSRSWLSSTQPRRQRKFRFNAPLHIKSAMMASTLAKDLRTKHNVRSLRVRTGDKVTVLRGQFKGKSGPVEKVDVAREQVYINGVEAVKKEGAKVPYPIHPSNLMITQLYGDDKRRFKQQTKEKKS